MNSRFQEQALDWPSLPRFVLVHEERFVKAALGLAPVPGAGKRMALILCRCPAVARLMADFLHAPQSEIHRLETVDMWRATVDAMLAQQVEHLLLVENQHQLQVAHLRDVVIVGHVV